MESKYKSEAIGFLILIVSFIALVVVCILDPDTGFIGIVLGAISVGLGFIAIGMAAKLDKDVANIPDNLSKNDTLVLTVEQVIRNVLTNQVKLKNKDFDLQFSLTDKQSQENAQKRLDEDTKRAGIQRGELFQLQDGSWAIHWNPSVTIDIGGSGRSG